MGYASVNRAAARRSNPCLPYNVGGLANEYDRVYVEVFGVTSDRLAGKEYESDKWVRAS